VVAMTDCNDFEAKAQRARPQQELKPKRCFVGVLSHEKSTQDALEETDFVWMVGHSVGTSASCSIVICMLNAAIASNPS
jgi:hypothetical protein